MQQFTGKSVYKGIVLGPVLLFGGQDDQVRRKKIEDAGAEAARVDAAREKAKEQLQVLYDKAVKEVGESSAAIFEVHQMMLDDDDYLDSIQNMIQSELVNAEYAVAMTGDNFSEMFANMDDDYMKARAADVKDISNRVIRILEGREEADMSSMDPAIIVADDLSPSETVQMDKEKILGFVTVHGSTNSHTAILARMMNIPALIGVPMDLGQIRTGMTAVVDGFEGTVTFEPNEELCAKTRKKMEEEQEKLRLLEDLKGQETVTKDGRKIHLYANIGSVSDVGYVLENDGEGIGLFRSEFLYLEAENYPTEEEQFQAYKKVVETMGGKKVIIRTLDIGADKKVDYFHLDPEENPALGYRAIRICLDRPEIFMTQLRAIYRASAYGKASIMFPMIVSVVEVKRIKEIVEQVKGELTVEGYPMGEVELGIMVETPAAALLSDKLAKEVDFFSIGTNDLTQYTLAVDRQNQKLESTCNTHHPAVLKLIEMTVKNGHKAGIWVGICGELAADTDLTETFLDMGVDELSVSPSSVLKVRKAVRDIKTN